MGLLSRTADMVYTFRFLKLLTTDFEDTPAYEMGIIDDKGKYLRRPETSEEKSAYTKFHKLVFNIKKIIGKTGSKLASYASALHLIKEEFGVDLDKINQKLNIDPADFIAEYSTWYVLESGNLAPGTYRLRESGKVLNSTGEEVGRKDDRIRVYENAAPVGNVYGLNIYEATHVRTRHNIYVTVGEIIK